MAASQTECSRLEQSDVIKYLLTCKYKLSHYLQFTEEYVLCTK